MEQFEDILVYRRRRMLTAAVVIVFLIFFGRLYQLQLLYREEYGKKSEENSLRVIPREPMRGYMFDRNGIMVVESRPAFTVTLMPYEFDKRQIEPLSRVLDLEPDFVQERLRKGEEYSRFAPVKVKRDINFRELSALEEHRTRYPGVDYQVESKRHYSTAARASHILGYTKEVSESQIRLLGSEYRPGDVVGYSGIEAAYEQALRGKKGAELSTVNVRGQVIGRFEDGKLDVAAVEGKDIVLTMDFSLQALAESLMTDKRGAVVALDPESGGILAMVSSPDYNLLSFSGITPPRVWRALNNDPARPLFNRATLTRYPPGSTFKMVLAIAALESGAITPSWRVNCRGAFPFGNKVFKDLHVHGSVDLTTAIQVSCNVYFYQLMLRVGLDTWAEYGRELGFGSNTGIDISEESPGLLPTTAWMNRRYGPRGWTKGFLPSLGIGQGELGVTPLQMACYAMAIANGGELYTPHAVSAILDKLTGRADTLYYPSHRLSVSPQTWGVVREGMHRAVMSPGGTGALARIKGVEVAGKTGTAQNPHGPDHAWFVGFAPLDRPRIAIAVMVENAGYGGSYAAPIAGMCMEHYLYGRLIRQVAPLPAIASRTPANPAASSP